MPPNKLPRNLLPQISQENLGDFIQYLAERGCNSEVIAAHIPELKPIQEHINREKVEKFKADPELLKKPIVISKGGWILDGHHRWIAAKELNPEGYIPAIQVECPINKLIIAAHRFEPSFTLSVYESTTYSKLLWKQLSEDEDPEGIELIVRKTLRPY